jgi:hypothetical protein
MDKYGYAGLWQVIGGDTLSYDAPSMLMSVINPLSSAHVTVQMLNQPETASLDNGPFVSAGRFVSQRTPHPGDLIGWFRMDGQSDATHFDTQYAGIKGAIGSAGAAPVGILRLETASGTGNKGSVPAMFCSKGCWSASTDGLGNSDFADPGWGNLATHSLTAQNAIIAGRTKVNGALADGSYSYLQPRTGFNITIANNLQRVVLDPAEPLASGTITMPAAPIDGQVVKILSSQGITTLVMHGNTGQALKGALTTVAANGFASWIYRAANATWYREG